MRIFRERKPVPTPDGVKTKLRSAQGALPKGNRGAQTAFHTAASAFKVKIVVTTQKRKKNRTQLDAEERPLSLNPRLVKNDASHSLAQTA